MNNIQNMLKCKKWALVGATNNQEKFGYKIFKFLKTAGMEVYAVNPGIEQIMEDKCYSSLAELPEKPEAVNIVVPPRIGMDIIRECAEIGIPNIWLQPGADADQVIELATQLGLNVVHHACIMVEIRNQGGV